jgi:hypothetical protein
MGRILGGRKIELVSCPFDLSVVRFPPLTIHTIRCRRGCACLNMRDSMDLMREIRFRAWDKHNKRMLHGKEVVISITGVTTVGGYINNDLMQFTGKKDKNGREIFDGDIVNCGERVGVGSLLRHTRGEVHYVESAACFCIQIPWIEYGNTDDGSKISWEIGHYSDIEVIGNIYESPETLMLGSVGNN